MVWQVQVVQSRSCLEEAERSVAQLESQVSQLTQRLESERTSAEAATLELASLSSAIQTNTDIMLHEKKDLSQQVYLSSDAKDVTLIICLSGFYF